MDCITCGEPIDMVWAGVWVDSKLRPANRDGTILPDEAFDGDEQYAQTLREKVVPLEAFDQSPREIGRASCREIV